MSQIPLFQSPLSPLLGHVTLCKSLAPPNPPRCWPHSHCQSSRTGLNTPASKNQRVSSAWTGAINPHVYTKF